MVADPDPYLEAGSGSGSVLKSNFRNFRSSKWSQGLRKAVDSLNDGVEAQNEAPEVF
jgi:hypothetical protein